MKNITTLCFCALLTLTSAPVFALPSNMDLGTCMSDALTGKERKLLARWIFFGISSHSSIEQFANIKDSDRRESDQFVGELITRLLTTDCPEQAKVAMASGSMAFQQAFKVIGEVAMLEIMAEPAVEQSLGAFEPYMDEDAFDILR